MIVGKIDPKSGVISTFSGDVMENDREIVVESVFEEGDYAVYLEIEWAQNLARDMVVSCYGDFSVTFCETDLDNRKTFSYYSDQGCHS